MDKMERRCVVYILTETMATGESDKFSTVARSSSTLALIGAEPLLNGLISTWILCSRSSSAIKQYTITSSPLWNNSPVKKEILLRNGYKTWKYTL